MDEQAHNQDSDDQPPSTSAGSASLPIVQPRKKHRAESEQESKPRDVDIDTDADLSSLLSPEAVVAGLLPSDFEPRNDFERRQQDNKKWARELVEGKLRHSNLYSQGDKEQQKRHGPSTKKDLVNEQIRFSNSRLLASWLSGRCRQAGMRKEPQDSFTRWIITRKMLEAPELPKPVHSHDAGDRVVDPIFPWSGSYDGGLYDELLKTRLKQKDALEIMEDLQSKSRSILSEMASSTSSSHDGAQVNVHHDRHTRSYSLSFSELKLDITEKIYDRLDRRYDAYMRSQGHMFSDGNDYRSSMNADLWRVLARYASLGGEGYQGGLREDVLMHLRKNFDVKHECFASPLNAYLDTYTSAFPDTDTVFGSLGSFFDLRNKHIHACGGSFEVNPPFIEEIMLATALYIDLWLHDDAPLLFFVFFPGWSDTPGYEVLNKSPFCRHSRLLRKRTHSYLPGFQHRPNRDQTTISYADTFIMVLQNAAGAKKWPVDNRSMDGIIKAMEGQGGFHGRGR